MGATYTETYSAKRCFTQPLIFYRLAATVKSKDASQQKPADLCTREITVMPTQAPKPPLYIEMLKDECTLSAAFKVRRNLCGRSIGQIQLSAEEPAPFNLLSSSPRASTSIAIKVLFSPTPSNAFGVEPYNWTWVVKSHLRTRVTYGTEDFHEEPTAEFLRKHPLVRLRTHTTAPETREYCDTSWRMDRLSQQGTIASTQAQLPWLTRLQAVVSVPKTLTPSFSSPRADLKYCVVLKVAVLGMAYTAGTLEIPVQLIRDARFLEKGAQLAAPHAHTRPREMVVRNRHMDALSGSGDGEERGSGGTNRPPRYQRCP